MSNLIVLGTGGAGAIAVLVIALSVRTRRTDYTDQDADMYLGPLRSGGHAEAKLTKDLSQRRMLLRHGAITEGGARRLAGAVASRARARQPAAAPTPPPAPAPQRGRHRGQPQSWRSAALHETRGRMHRIPIAHGAGTTAVATPVPPPDVPTPAVAGPAEDTVVFSAPLEVAHTAAPGAPTTVIPAAQDDPATAYTDRQPFRAWESDTFVGGFPAVTP